MAHACGGFVERAAGFLASVLSWVSSGIFPHGNWIPLLFRSWNQKDDIVLMSLSLGCSQSDRQDGRMCDMLVAVVGRRCRHPLSPDSPVAPPFRYLCWAGQPEALPPRPHLLQHQSHSSSGLTSHRPQFAFGVPFGLPFASW